MERNTGKNKVITKLEGKKEGNERAQKQTKGLILLPFKSVSKGPLDFCKTGIKMKKIRV